MENSGYVSLMRSIALRNYVDVVTNNVANANTDGYSREIMVFSEVLHQDGSKPQLSFSHDNQTLRDFSKGEFRVTNNTFDLAIVNYNSYFGVETLNGRRYTRNGSFQLSQEGGLTTKSGSPVLSVDGGRITLPADALNIVINASGDIIVDDQVVAKIGVFHFGDNRTIEKDGNNLLRKIDNELEPTILENPQIKQGVLEGSNVSPISEMTHLITTSKEMTDVVNLSTDLNKMQHDLMKILLQNQ